ncbi:hypothetical protein Q6272_31105, partial [Klebsiella pneumoniae]|uniref:histidine kinase dimerization/phospho-acceptor domain-containing protein n=1 Tax=Klebsiella pneumoniae TaxID=573 RepID=UPI002752C418|nr:hypothetical protein [Klebsiella pneumoniae]
MLMRLDDGVQQLSQFSDDLAHELRAPLSNLMGKAQVALTRERSLPEYRELAVGFLICFRRGLLVIVSPCNA